MKLFGTRTTKVSNNEAAAKVCIASVCVRACVREYVRVNVRAAVERVKGEGIISMRI